MKWKKWLENGSLSVYSWLFWPISPFRPVPIVHDPERHSLPR